MGNCLVGMVEHQPIWKGNKPYLGDILTMVINHLQVIGSSSK